MEYDGVTTAAYVYDQTAVIAAVWLANHQPAPAAADPAQVEAGQAPVMPAGTPSIPAAAPRWTRASSARCGSRRATGWPWWTAGSCSR